MRYYLSDKCVLRWLEMPCIYDIKKDELYELDDEAFNFFRICISEGCEAEEDNEFIKYCISEGLLTKNPVNTIHPDIIKSPDPSLRYLELQITDRCNLKCRHCYIGEPENRELSFIEIKRILDEFELMQGLRILITGGEPLMHNNFIEINALLPEYKFRKVLFTNGLLLDEDIIRGLNVEEIQFSVDGMRHGHEAIRGKGTYSRVMKNIRSTIDSGITVSIATMIHKENLHEFDDMKRLFESLKIKDWTVDVPCIEGRFKENSIFHVQPEIAGRYLKYGFGDGLHGAAEGYACGYHLLSVLANGNICRCSFYKDKPIGHLRDGIRSAWGKIKHLKLKDLQCSDISCRVIDSCRGGCRYRAELIARDNRKKDIYKCYEYDMI